MIRILGLIEISRRGGVLVAAVGVVVIGAPGARLEVGAAVIVVVVAVLAVPATVIAIAGGGGIEVGSSGTFNPTWCHSVLAIFHC